MEDKSIYEIDTEEYTRPLYLSAYFNLNKIGDGLYAAIARTDEGGDKSNAGLIDMGSYTIAFDSFILPQSTADLIRVSEQMLGKEIRAVISSHHHYDHTWGDAAYSPETAFISTEISRNHRIENSRSEMADTKKKIPATLNNLKRHRATASNPVDQSNLDSQIRFYQALNESLGEISPRIPTITFTDMMELHGEKRTVKVMSFNPAHTLSDTILYLPNEGIIFAGDLLFSNRHPFMVESNPLAWIDVTNKLLELNFSIIVPGHGPVGDRDSLLRMQQYLIHIVEEARDIINSGGTARQVSDRKPPREYAHWTKGSYTENLRNTYDFLIKLEM